MNTNILPTPVMIAISGEWLGNPAITREINKSALGASIWKEIEAAHVLAVDRSRERMSIEARIAELIKLGSRFDDIHDDRARVLYHLLLMLADATHDAALAEFLRKLHKLMFPRALRIVHMSYLAEAGEVIELEARMTPEILTRLESVRVADQTLADIYRSWVEAGKELGRYAQERARLEASLGMQGTTASRTHSRKVRTKWIRAVRLLLDALAVIDLPESTREHLLAPLEAGIQAAIARRAQGNPQGDNQGDNQGDSELDGDIGSDIDSDIGPTSEARVSGATVLDAPATPAVGASATLALDAFAMPALDAAFADGERIA